MPAVNTSQRRGIHWKRVLIISAVGALLVIGILYGLAWVGKNNWAKTFGVPEDFPTYPAAALAGVRETVGTGGTRVDASWEADAPLATVTTFYSERLNEAPWQIVGKNSVDGTWELRRTDGMMRGYLQLVGHGQQTRVNLTLFK